MTSAVRSIEQDPACRCRDQITVGFENPATKRFISQHVATVNRALRRSECDDLPWHAVASVAKNNAPRALNLTSSSEKPIHLASGRQSTCHPEAGEARRGSTRALNRYRASSHVYGRS